LSRPQRNHFKSIGSHLLPNGWNLTMATQADDERDYFTDLSVLKDPYEYFETVRAKCPVHQLTNRDMLVVTGFDETLEILKNAEDFSSSIAVQGTALPLPFEPQGHDIVAQIDANRSKFKGGDSLVTYDDKQHTFSRSIINRLFTPSRLKANEAYIQQCADELIRNAVAQGGCELISEIASPFVTLVIADLLGVPDDDREVFRKVIDSAPPPGDMETEGARRADAVHPLEFMARYFVGYLTERRANPGQDVLSDLATAKYPDGSTPDLMEIVRLSTFLFGAGQDTSAKLLGNAMRFIVEDPELQRTLRADPSLIPAFIEEVLRLEGSTKMTSRVARRDTRIGDIEVPAGKKILIAFAAANRDPERWEDPRAFKLDRPRAKEHVAFGRGAHVCAGAPLARVEIRVILEKFFEHTSEIDLLESEHGPRGDRTLDYEPSFIIRGLAAMHLTLKPR
jgi:cytochrome P450